MYLDEARYEQLRAAFVTISKSTVQRTFVGRPVVEL